MTEAKPRPHHVTLRDLRVWACPGGGIAASHCDYITIEDCTVSGCAWYSTYGCSGISVWQAWNYDKEPGYHIRIRGNRCFDNRQYLPVKPGGNIMDGDGIIIDDSRNTQQGSKLSIYEGRVLIEGNTSFNNGGSGIHVYESDHVDILGNVVWMNNQTPEYTNGQLFVNDASDIRIEGNTIGAVEGKDATNNFRRNDQSAAVAQTAFVFLPVVFAEVAPVAVMMAGKGGEQFFVGNGGDCAGCGDDAAEWELSQFRRGCACGFVGDVMDDVVMCGGAARTPPAKRNASPFDAIRISPADTSFSPPCSTSLAAKTRRRKRCNMRWNCVRRSRRAGRRRSTARTLTGPGGPASVPLPC